jgi:hypothetical protein
LCYGYEQLSGVEEAFYQTLEYPFRSKFSPY